MGLQHKLDQFRIASAKTVPPARVAPYEEKIEELRRSFARDNAIGVGDLAPDFTLSGAQNGRVRLHDRLAAGPVVIAFYRGGWCPYCNIQLRAYQDALSQITALGASLMAISPQAPDSSLSTAEVNAFFDVLSDRGNAAARSFGLVFTLPDDMQNVMRSAGKALPEVNGDDSWELPVPSTFVVGMVGRVAFASVEVDYRKRLERNRIVEALVRLQAAAPIRVA